MTTQTSAIRAYARRYDELAELGQVLVASGRYEEAEDVHATARIVIRAYDAEQRDPTPKVADVWCVCQTCQAWLFEAHWKRLA